MPAQLDHRHRLAIRLLAECLSISEVANACGVCEATLRRWKRIPEFDAALDAEMQRRLDDAGAEFDARMRSSLAAQSAAQRELRAFITGRTKLPYKRAMQLCAVLNQGSRLLDRARINTKSENWREFLLAMRENDENALETVSPIQPETNIQNKKFETPLNPIIFAHWWCGSQRRHELRQNIVRALRPIPPRRDVRARRPTPPRPATPPTTPDRRVNEYWKWKMVPGLSAQSPPVTCR